MKRHIITLGGLPGSGKTTVRKILADMLGYKTFSTGGYVREMAYNKQMTLEAFNTLMADDPSIDLSIDQKLKDINTHGNDYIVDAHLAFHFVPVGFSVFLKTSEQKASERLLSDSTSEARIKSGEVVGSLEEAKSHVRWRIQNNIDRYQKLYRVNPYDEKLFAYCVDAESLSPQEIAESIVTAYKKWLESDG